MPRRNEDDYEERRQQLIDGALQVFARKGFEEATNKEIAAAAGIGSPGLIYHYFKDREDLLRQVLEERIPMLQLLAHPEELLALPPAEALARFGRAYLKVTENRAAVAIMKLVFGEAIRRPAVARLFVEIGPGRAFRFLAGYMERQMAAGVLRRMDPEAAVRCFMGPLVLFILQREIFQQPEAREQDPETVLAAALEVFMRAMQPG
jgi:AcrR family transcriptional regulator